MRDNIHDRARGRWKSMLPMLGIPAAYLTGRHMACPVCGGKDRYRFDDKAGDGSFYCNQCGPGSGIDLVMRIHKIGFKDAVAMVEEHIGVAPVVVKTRRDGPDRLARMAADVWSAGRALDGTDPASKYLASRGLVFAAYPTQLRFGPCVTYVDSNGLKTQHPALLAQFVSPAADERTLHVTYIDDAGRKAALDPVRKLARGRVPPGGCVRLAPSADTLGIAEGIETALSAMQLFDVPVWAALNAGMLTKWEPPASARCVIVFADCDDNFTGQAAAFALAHRLRLEGRHVEVRVPDELNTDWNDVLMGECA